MTQPGWMPTDMAPVGGLGAPLVVNIGGRMHPTADGLIDRAHRGTTDRGMYFIGSKLTIVDPPRIENDKTAIVHAKAIFRDAQSGEMLEFEDLGDANVGNCSGQTGMAFIRMAATRALSRAISQALNISEAVAEEIANGGTGNFAPSAGAQPGQQAQGQQQTNKPEVAAAFPNAPSWKFTINGGNHAKKRIDDPSVPDSELTYQLGRGFNMKNQQTGNYDVPDPERAAIFQAELNRRQALGSQQPAPQGQQPAAPNYGQQQQQAYQPPVQQAYQPPAQQAYQPPVQQGAWSVQPTMITDLLNLCKAQGGNWMNVKQASLDDFGEGEPKNLDRDTFNMLRMRYGGAPI